MNTRLPGPMIRGQTLGSMGFMIPCDDEVFPGMAAIRASHEHPSRACPE